MSSPSRPSQKAPPSAVMTWEDWIKWDSSTAGILDRGNVSPPIASDNAGLERHLDNVQVPNPDSSPDGSKTPNKKRKVSGEINEIPPPQVKDRRIKSGSGQNKSHSFAEKRYRTNLNEKIAELSQSVPSLRDGALSQADVHAPATGLAHNKGTVLAKAIEYIHHLEKRNAYLEHVNKVSKNRTPPKSAEKQDDEGSLETEKRTPQSCSSPSQTQASTSGIDEPRGMIPVPADIKRLRDLAEIQPHYADQAPFVEDEMNQTSGKVTIAGGRSIGKLMLGSLAGLMIMDGFAGVGEEEAGDRGLLALPASSFVRPLRIVWIAGRTRLAAPHSKWFLVPLTRCFIVFSILGIMLFLYLFNSKPVSKFNAATSERTFRLSNSPIEMRRNAWLTAIQTVWVPRHSMLPELVALICETNAYITRQLLGWRSYSWMTGRSEDDEIARVRAWEIAIDAQLAGGDAEMSRSRLVLTLWASGTLPRTPANLMLKALHIRITFCQASRYLWISETLTSAARKIASTQWSLAQEMMNNPKVSKTPAQSEPLPDHLVGLLQRPIDEIMTDHAIQHIYSLAWNGALLGNPEEGDLPMHTEDTAMLGSLDSLAALSSDSKLHQALCSVIVSNASRESYQSQIEMALRIAPPGSISSLRALAATAIVSEVDRRASIIGLMGALPSSDDTLPQRSLSAIPFSPATVYHDVVIATDCAKALELLVNPEKRTAVHGATLDIIVCTLSNIGSLDLLAFVGIYQLVLSMLELKDLADRDAHVIGEYVANAIAQLDQHVAHQRANNQHLRQQYRTALQKLVVRRYIESPGRRMSNYSIDTGYGSLSENDQKT